MKHRMNTTIQHCLDWKDFNSLSAGQRSSPILFLLLVNFPLYPSKTTRLLQTYLTILGYVSPQSGGLGAFLGSQTQSTGTGLATGHWERGSNNWGLPGPPVHQSGYNRKFTKHLRKAIPDLLVIHHIHLSQKGKQHSGKSWTEASVEG